MGGCAGGLLNGLDGGVAGFDSRFDVTHGDASAEAYSLFQIHLTYLFSDQPK
jgi:hypothetical protein